MCPTQIFWFPNMYFFFFMSKMCEPKVEFIVTPGKFFGECVSEREIIWV